MIAAFVLAVVPLFNTSPGGTRPQNATGAAQAAGISGTVHDPEGAVVAGATVIARTPAGAEERTLTGPDGKFAISLPPPFELTVLAGGFAQKKQQIASAAREALDVRLSPAEHAEQVLVTPTRNEQRVGDVPASVNVLSREEIRQSPGVVADEVLRQVPTFSLFRRASSVSAHPTTQGVSLRGIAPSGVSRTLVLLDGVPYNDPFGGWVYWTGLPLNQTNRIEVVDNASSSLYGNYAMGGVINIVTDRPSRRTVEFNPQFGNRGTSKADFRASDVWGKVGVSVDGVGFDTDGYPNVVPSERRTTDQTPPGVDNSVTAKFQSYNFKANYTPSDRVQVYGRVGYLREDRNNGKASTYDPAGNYIGGQTEEANNTRWTATNVGTRVILPDQSTLQATLFTDNETFRSNFLAVPTANPPRSIGRVSLDQRVPTKGVGGMAQWSKGLGSTQTISGGFDWRWIEGESQEQGYDTTKNVLTPTVTRYSGGSQQLSGAFVQDIITPAAPLQITLSARVDHWRNYNPHNLETTTSTGKPTANYKPECSTVSNPSPGVNCLDDRTDTVVSPRVAAMYHVTGAVSVWGDYGLGFRAPTLNELYRQFTVGAVTTRANDQLGPEHLKGGEIGVNIQPARGAIVRTTYFDNRMRDPISNVTIGTNLQQRQNLGRTKIAGLQLDGEYHAGPMWQFNAGYVYERARVVESAATLGLPAGTNLATNCPGPNANNPTGTTAGNGTGAACYLQQVPRNRATFRAAYINDKIATIAFNVTVIGRQFDDDQNARVVPNAALSDAGYAQWTTPVTDPNIAGLPQYTILDLSASRALGRNVDVYAACENLANKQYFVGTVPTLLGPPRLFTIGLRLRWQGK
jgi:outer membrane receptor protein involved in Fe transport